MRLLSQQEDDLKEMLKKQQAEEAKTLPVILNFVLSQADAEKVQMVLQHFDADQNAALIKICQEVSEHE